VTGGDEACEAIVLRAMPHGEKFEQLALLTPESGVTRALMRVHSGKGKASVGRDQPAFMDRGLFTFESGRGSAVRFVRGFELLHRPEALGRSYARLQAAATLAAFMELNVPHMDGSAEAWDSLTRALRALEDGAPADTVILKAQFRLALREGYPVREHWLQSLPARERAIADALIHTPLAQLDAAITAEAAGILQSFQRFLVGETEFRV